MYAIDFTPAEDRQNCANGACTNMRNMTLFATDDAIWRSYTFTGNTAKIEETLGFFLSNMGKVMSAEENCFAL